MVVLAVVAVGWVVLYRSPAFSVRTVEVAGATRLGAKRVVAEAKVPAGATLLRLPTAGIESRLLKDPWIGSVDLRRRFPSTLLITVAERVPVAAVETTGASWLVDSQGVTIAKQSAGASTPLPTIRDIEGFKPRPGVKSGSAGLANALGVLQGIGPRLRAEVRGVTAASVDETALLTKEGVEILIGPATELAKKDAIVTRILAEQRGKVVFIDVRTTDRPVSKGLGE